MKTTRRALAFRVPMRDPGDVSGVVELFDSGVLRPEEVVAVLGKTEGNGCVNDFSQPYATNVLATTLGTRMGLPQDRVAHRVALVMSGGTEGGLSPHFLVLGAREEVGDGTGALALGVGFTPELPPEAIGRIAQVRAIEAAVRMAMGDAGIVDPAEVHLVQVKCPLITSVQAAEAASRGKSVATTTTYASMGLSRAAAALGVALALGEIPEAEVTEAAIGRDLSLFSDRASCSSGVELQHAEVVVLGNSPAWTGDLRIGHDVMRDAIDLPAVQRAMASAGLAASGQGQLDEGERDRVVAVLAKAGASSAGTIRGLRHVMNDDSDIHFTRHARALVGGVIAAAVGRTDLFVSGGAEHQGPDGGGPIAVIARA